MPPTTHLSASLPHERIRRGFTALLLAGIATACTSTAPRTGIPRPWDGARQMIVVTTANWDASEGQLRRFERTGADWHPLGPVQPVQVGRSGSAWGLGLHPDPQADTGAPIKREGDGRSPAGVFAIGEAFGYAERIDTALDYLPMQASHYCIDVPGSPLYNRIVDTGEVGTAAVEGSTEPMRRDIHADGDHRYAQGFVIRHNPAHQSPAGSCIFAHVWKAPDVPTAGCTAMSTDEMSALLGWLRTDARPVFVLLPDAEYARLQADWRLPPITDAQDILHDR